MEGCSFKVIVGGLCGYNTKDWRHKTEIDPLLLRNKDITNHKFTNTFTEPEDDRLFTAFNFLIFSIDC